MRSDDAGLSPGLSGISRHPSRSADTRTVPIFELRATHPYRLVNVAPRLASLPSSYRDATSPSGSGAGAGSSSLLEPATGRVVVALADPPWLERLLLFYLNRDQYQHHNFPRREDSPQTPPTRVESGAGIGRRGSGRVRWLSER